MERELVGNEKGYRLGVSRIWRGKGSVRLPYYLVLGNGAPEEGGALPGGNTDIFPVPGRGGCWTPCRLVRVSFCAT